MQTQQQNSFCFKRNSVKKKTGKKSYYQNDEANKMYLLHNVKNLANNKVLRQMIQNNEFFDCSNQLQECMIQTKLNSLQQIKAPVIKTPLSKPINYLTKKTVNLNFKNDIQTVQKSIDAERKSFQLPKISTKSNFVYINKKLEKYNLLLALIPPPPVVLKKPKKNKKKNLKKQIEKEHLKTESVDIQKEYQEIEEPDQIELNYLIRQEDL